jgi:hypothetical protein
MSGGFLNDINGTPTLVTLLHSLPWAVYKEPFHSKVSLNNENMSNNSF